jgi:hypothetical protein
MGIVFVEVIFNRPAHDSGEVARYKRRKNQGMEEGNQSVGVWVGAYLFVLCLTSLGVFTLISHSQVSASVVDYDRAGERRLV